MEELVAQYKAFRLKTAQWEKERNELKKEISTYIGQKAAWQLCKSDLEARISELRRKIEIVKEGKRTQIIIKEQSEISAISDETNIPPESKDQSKSQEVKENEETKLVDEMSSVSQNQTNPEIQSDNLQNDKKEIESETSQSHAILSEQIKQENIQNLQNDQINQKNENNQNDQINQNNENKQEINSENQPSISSNVSSISNTIIEIDESNLPEPAPLSSYSFPPPTSESFSYSVKYTFTSHLDSVRALCFYQQSPVLVTASDDGTIHITNVNPPAPKTKKKTRSNPILLSSLRGHEYAPISLFSFLQDSKEMLISGDISGLLCIWELPPNSESISSLYDQHGLITHHCIKSVQLHSDAIWNIISLTSPLANPEFFITSSADGTTKIFSIHNPENGKAIKTKGYPVCAVSLPEFGSIAIALSNGLIQFFNSEKLCLFLTNSEDISSEQEIRISGRPVCMCTKEELIYIGCSDGKLRVIDGNSKTLIHESNVHQAAVRSIDITNDNAFIITVGDDSQVRAWKTGNFEMAFGDKFHKSKFGEGTLCYFYS